MALGKRGRGQNTLEGPVLRASPGSVEGGVLILLSAVGKVVRIQEELRISLPGQKCSRICYVI